MNKKNNIIVVGGKTGGHIYPALAISSILRKFYNVVIYYIGSKNGMESEILKKEIIKFYGLNLKPLVGINFFYKILNILINIKAFFKSLYIIKKINPKVIIGTGGFVCGPVLLAAFLLKIPIILHEQNVEPGLTNKILSHIASEIWLTFSDSAVFFPKNKRKILTGMP